MRNHRQQLDPEIRELLNPITQLRDLIASDQSVVGPVEFEHHRLTAELIEPKWFTTSR